MIVFRIVQKKYANKLFAPGRSGRWNSEGKKVIYTASSRSLAVMENMVHRNGYGFNDNFATIIIEIPDKLNITEHSALSIPRGWNKPKDYSVSQPIGDQWYDSLETPVLKVPSAIIPQEFNFILHSQHPDYDRIKIVQINEFLLDERIEEMINKNSSESE